MQSKQTAQGVDLGAELRALQDCAASVIKAADGRGIRGARVACRNALVKAGHHPQAAQKLADHGAAWAADWWHSVAVRVATWKAGAAS
jgi:hypothetical protein